MGYESRKRARTHLATPPLGGTVEGAVVLGQQPVKASLTTPCMAQISYREAMLYHSCAERCTEAVPLGRQQG